jgi:hypothetical protein
MPEKETLRNLLLEADGLPHSTVPLIQKPALVVEWQTDTGRVFV